MPKKPRVRTFLRVNMLKALKNCLNLHGSIFILFFDDSEITSDRKILPE